MDTLVVAKRYLRLNAISITTPHHPFQGYSNHTITTSVTIRVTPIQDHFVPWGILWAGFVVASAIAAWQAVREHQILALRRAAVDNGGPTGASVVGDGESVSSADITRCMFRRLLLLAMVTRVILIPIQIWSDPLWWQFVGDTLPEMVFASAWTLLVTFFVQVVGIATGSGTDTSPSIVISATAYVVYIILITTQLFNTIASVLLYALMCCIYATLFGVVMYFCPRLLTLLKPSLGRHGGLATRLVISTAICIFIFAAHAVDYARLVVAPPRQVFWWWQYGILELVPAVIFLVIMHPSMNKCDRNLNSPAPDIPRGQGSGGLRWMDAGLRRVDSGSLTAGNHRRAGETAPLMKGTPGYGT